MIYFPFLNGLILFPLFFFFFLQYFAGRQRQRDKQKSVARHWVRPSVVEPNVNCVSVCVNYVEARKLRHNIATRHTLSHSLSPLRTAAESERPHNDPRSDRHQTGRNSDYSSTDKKCFIKSKSLQIVCSGLLVAEAASGGNVNDKVKNEKSTANASKSISSAVEVDKPREVKLRKIRVNLLDLFVVLHKR